ncbi:hypothetical protein CAAN1_14S02388 [[Candida] anglica]
MYEGRYSITSLFDENNKSLHIEPNEKGLSIHAAGTKMRSSIATFYPKARILKLRPSSSGLDSCKNTCQHCLKVFSQESHPDVQQVIFPKVNAHGIADPLSPITCGFCLTYRYCSYQCYLRDWYSYHQHECPIFVNIRPGDTHAIDQTTRLIIRLYICCELDPNFKQRVLMLMSHVDKIEEGQNNDESNAQLVQDITYDIWRSISKPFISEEYIKILACITMINSNVFLNARYEEIGMMVEPDLSLINHSCLPNVVILPITTDSFSLIVTQPWEDSSEVFINYCVTNLPTFLRRETLKRKFYFTCQCDLCQSDKDLFFSYNCPSCGNHICTLEIDGFFSTDNNSESLNCSTCSSSISTTTVLKVKSLHRELFALLLFEFGDQRDAYEEVPVLQILKELESIPVERLVHMLVAQVCGIDINGQTSPRYTSLLSSIRHTKIVPTYCFPLNVVTASLLDYYRDLNLEFASGKQLLQYIITTVRACFEVDIVSDLSEAKFYTHGCMNNIGNTLFIIAAMICRRRGVMVGTASCKTKSDESRLIEVLIKCSFYFMVQALESSNPYNYYPTLQDEYWTSTINIWNFCRNYLLEFPTNLVLWGYTNPILYTQDSFTWCLKELFHISEARVLIQDDKFLIELADRTLAEPFVGPYQKLAFPKIFTEKYVSRRLGL